MRKYIRKHYCMVVAVVTALSMGTARAEPNGGEQEPLVLRKIMKDLGTDMQKIVDGISREDWSLVEQAAMRIADHPRPPLREKLRILAFIGTDMSKFKSLDKETHETARLLASRAKENDGRAVIETFAKLQLGCLACHQEFRQPLRQHFYGHQGIGE